MADPSTYRPRPGTIPTDPGVYRFSDGDGRVIYVGKAKNLRNRLNSYFADPAGLAPKTLRMVTAAAKVEWTVVQNELESLQLEYTWIQQYAPRFNVKYRDDKSYPWLCVTWSDEFPRVFVGRGAKRRGWRYYGPFGQAWAIRETVDLLLRVFPMRSCSNGAFRQAQTAGRPCLLGYIGKCSAPCVGRIDAASHRDLAADFCSFMAGHSHKLERRLATQMQQASDDLEFERAAVLRDSLTALRQASERNAIVFADGTDADVIALADDGLEVAFQVFHVRSGRVRGERGLVADRSDDSTVPELVEQFLLQLYSDAADHGDAAGEAGHAIPKEILVPVEPASGDALAELLSTRRGGAVRIHVPLRGAKRVLADTVAKNAEETLAQHKLKRASDLSTRSRALEEIQVALGMTVPPLRIECYDISHLQGTNVVGSMVVFEDGLARKPEYRRFIIKGFEGSNDVRAIDEVVRRRLHRLADERQAIAAASAGGQTEAAGVLIDAATGAPRRFSYAPNLMVIDGGAPQVNAAQRVFDDLGITDIALVGLAKRLEEVWLPGEEYPLILPRTSEGLYLLQRVRDEAHRFAISFHRQRRTKSMVESALDAVPGLGEVRRRALLRYFGSLKKLRAASADDLAQVPGIGPVVAASIVQALGRDEPAPSVNAATGEIVED